MTDQEEPSTPDLTNSVREQRCEADVAREQDRRIEVESRVDGNRQVSARSVRPPDIRPVRNFSGD